MSKGTPASAIFGSPKNPCSGSGICDLHKKPIDSGLAINVTVSSNKTRMSDPECDMTINIAPDQLLKLNDVRPDIYYSLVHRNELAFSNTFFAYYCNHLSHDVWTEEAFDQWGVNHPQCEVKPQPDGSIDIHFLPGCIFRTAKWGMVGDPDGDVLSTGNWDIYQDVYGNLVFTNDTDRNLTGITNSVIFGYGGYISSYRYSVQQTEAAGSHTHFNQSVPLVSDWSYGQSDNGDLCFAHNINQGSSMVIFGADGQNIYTNGFAIESVPTMAPIYQINIPDGTVTHDFGDWKIGEDEAGNLCFQNFARGNSFYFGKSHAEGPYAQIYVQGGRCMAVTGYPNGENTFDKTYRFHAIAGSGGADGKVPAEEGV